MPRYQDPLAELTGSDSESDADEEPSIEAVRAQKKCKQAEKIDLQALQQHGYRSGPSVLGSGKDTAAATRGDSDSETAEERQLTRAAATTGAETAAALSQKAMQQNLRLKSEARAERRQMANESKQTFQQKEKRKRDAGQAKSAKNYVEEEKRLARNLGVYSGFDT